MIPNADPNDPIIEFSNVQFSFSGPKTIFHHLSLKLLAGNFYLIRGPSGAGKTTFLRLINRLEEPDDGHIWFEGHRLDAAAVDCLCSTNAHADQWDGSEKPFAGIFLQKQPKPDTS
jgi:ABC-type multidrug transport system fused ATPase/permease subunit